MARRRTKIKVQTPAGTVEEHDAWEEEFETVREEWNEYKLLDGGSVRIKATPHKIYRLIGPDGAPLRTADGDPQVVVRQTVQVVASD